MEASRVGTILRLLLLLCIATTRAADANADVKDTPLAGSVHLLQIGECNIVVSAGDDGVVAVDTCVAKTADKLLAAIRRLSSKPIRFVIDTHYHGDHTEGNAAFQALAPVIAHHSVRTRLATGNVTTGDKPLPPEYLPIVTFDSEIVLHLNGEEIRLLHLPPGHTDGDVVVFFKNANVVCMGDDYMSPAVSFGAAYDGGGMLLLMEALERVLPQIPNDAKVIPGHGTISTRADVVHGLEVMQQMKAAVELGIKNGKTLEQLTAERPFDQWRSSLPKWASSDKSLDSRVRNFYREISARTP